jgi:transcriptional antiterminator NusG
MSDIETPMNAEDVVADEIIEITILEEDFEEPVAESAFDRPGRWYIVHTFAGHEQKVIGALRNIIKSRELEDQIYEIYLPEEDVTEFKSGKKVTVSKRMFPSYLLIRCEPDPEIF